jgi:hypothetical protein
MNYIVKFTFKGCFVEWKYKDEEDFLDKKFKVEKILENHLRNGKTIIECIQHYFGEMIGFTKIWDELPDNNLKHFISYIIILKKLKVEFSEVGEYGWEVLQQKKRTFKPCSVCQVETKMKCSCCKKVYYCSEACQKSDWKSHRESIKLEKAGKSCWICYPALNTGVPDICNTCENKL